MTRETKNKKLIFNELQSVFCRGEPCVHPFQEDRKATTNQSPRTTIFTQFEHAHLYSSHPQPFSPRRERSLTQHLFGRYKLEKPHHLSINLTRGIRA
jgi:hypothetical protein